MSVGNAATGGHIDVGGLHCSWGHGDVWGRGLAAVRSVLISVASTTTKGNADVLWSKLHPESMLMSIFPAALEGLVWVHYKPGPCM